MYILPNKIKIPKIGFGTWQIPPGEIAYNSVLKAIKVGYRHIDTAHSYGNEKSVGQAIKDSGIKREELFITSKLPSHIKDYEATIKYFDLTMKNLDLEYLDLYLIHAPWPWDEIGKDCKEGNILAWEAMIEFYQSGKVRAIGVSNFNKDDIENIVKHTGFLPHVNQIQHHIGYNQREIVEYCEEQNIFVEAYSPLGTGRVLKNNVVIEMANKYNVTPAQICIKYCLEKNTAPLPKSTNESRMIENLNINFNISKADLEILDKL